MIVVTSKKKKKKKKERDTHRSKNRGYRIQKQSHTNMDTLFGAKEI